MKKTIENFIVIKGASIANNKQLITLLDKYEELNLMCYTDNETDKLVIGDPKNKELKDQMEHMIDNFKNPFEEMYHWTKGEIYDLEALAEAVTAKDNLEKNLKKLEAKKKETQADLENVN